MRLAHRLALLICAISLGGFALFWAPALLGLPGLPVWSLAQYLAAVMFSQIPASVIVGLIYLVAWLVARRRRVR